LEELQTQVERAEVDMVVGAAEGLGSRLLEVPVVQVIITAEEAEVEVGMEEVEVAGIAIRTATMEEVEVAVPPTRIQREPPM
jgi:hypothetical protein